MKNTIISSIDNNKNLKQIFEIAGISDVTSTFERDPGYVMLLDDDMVLVIGDGDDGDGCYQRFISLREMTDTEINYSAADWEGRYDPEKADQLCLPFLKADVPVKLPLITTKSLQYTQGVFDTSADLADFIINFIAEETKEFYTPEVIVIEPVAETVQMMIDLNIPDNQSSDCDAFFGNDCGGVHLTEEGIYMMYGKEVDEDGDLVTYMFDPTELTVTIVVRDPRRPTSAYTQLTKKGHVKDAVMERDTSITGFAQFEFSDSERNEFMNSVQEHIEDMRGF